MTFVCYAFNLNLSSWVGGIALRYRLYSRLGLDVSTITRILSLSLITNWLGYMLLAGFVFSMRFLELPKEWSIGTTTLQLIGFGLLAVCFAYLLACRFSKKRSWTIRDQEFNLPSMKQALMQASLGALNWSLMAAVIYTLLPDKAFYPAILGVLLISSIAGVITHIPAGLGVLETVFITLLAHQFSKGQPARSVDRLPRDLLPAAAAAGAGGVSGAGKTREENGREEPAAHGRGSQILRAQPSVIKPDLFVYFVDLEFQAIRHGNEQRLAQA